MLMAPNLTIVCSKSGKLTRALVGEFLDSVVAPKASGNILYLIDHWGGQMDDNLYTSRFSNESCNMRVSLIPENCTDLVQPLDTYFHRQFKFLVRQFYDYAVLHGDDKLHATLVSRNGALKVHSLAHFILSSPKFKEMIRYCWFTSGLLVGEKSDYTNVKQICFEMSHMICCTDSCGKLAFIKCSWCDQTLCFDCFYHDYHLMYCANSPYLKV